MPTYEYACRECGEHVEKVQSFGDDPLTTCPACGGPLRKVFGSIGVVFKGSGFYKTDSRTASKEPASAKESSTTESGSKDAKTAASDSGAAKDGAGSAKEKSTADSSSSAPKDNGSSPSKSSPAKKTSSAGKTGSAAAAS